MAYQEKPEMNDWLAHYGIKRRSGRYPYGSGKEPYQHSGDFLSRVKELKEQGLTETEIAETLGIVNEKGVPSSTRLRTQLSLAKDERRSLEVDKAKALREKGYSLNEIAKKMGYANDSSIRSLLNAKSESRMNQAYKTAEALKAIVDKQGLTDVGGGVERELNISREKLDQALYILELEGYPTYGNRVEQPTNPGKKTTLKVLCPPGTEHKAIYNPEDIHPMKDYISRDGGDTIEPKFHYPASLDSRRLKINYNEDGGIEKDGLIEIRRDVPDLSLGESRYAQVRILVDGTHYLKGMAIYSDDIPDGVDIVFNTNKKRGTPVKKVLKEIKKNSDNPFGATIKDGDKGGQYWYEDPKTGKKKLGLINKRSDEGDWSDWKDKLPSQFLSKQPDSLAKKQLGIAIKDKENEFNDICALTNPTVKKKLLQSFSDDCDSAAVHLYAAALPRQKYHVLIPISSLKDNEIYAPKYDNGEKVALIRYPHGGPFEIPILTVNNKHAISRKLLGNADDAVGINSKVAERLSGADFDGDTAMVIPTNDKVRIKSTPELEGLKGFDPKFRYGTIEKEDGYYNDKGLKIKIMSDTQNQMGRISNLITDMTIKGATDDEKAKAVRHSMVVIDAEKHKLDYQQSYIDNDIALLKKKYQGRTDQDGSYHEGASTLLSRAKAQTTILKRQGTPKPNIKGKDWYDPTKPEGALIYKTSDDLYYPDRFKDKATGMITIRTTTGKNVTYDSKDPKASALYEPVKRVNDKTGEVYFTDKSGKIVYKHKTRTEKSTQMAETDDARTLISDYDAPMERLYADYANKMKSLANMARVEMASTKKIEYSKHAKTVYAKEVESLLSKLNDAEKNAPRERTAILMVNAAMKAKMQDNPDMTKEEIKKHKQQELVKARNIVGSKRKLIDITDKEWEAIQAGAIHENSLKKILENTDIDVIREKATPKARKELSEAKINKIASMNAMGYTLSQIAASIGVSTSTVSKYLKKGK